MQHFDGDGDQDLLYQQGNTSGLALHYAKNNNNGTFTDFIAPGGIMPAGTPFAGLSFTKIMNPDKSATGQIFGQRVFDYDGDGDVDLLEVSTTAAPRLLLQNAGNFSTGNHFSGISGNDDQFSFKMGSRKILTDGDTDILFSTGKCIRSRKYHLF